MVQMCQAKAGKGRGVVENGGLVFCTEACGEGISCLGGSAVDAVDEGRDGGWC
jgi:hypothetical protein